MGLDGTTAPCIAVLSRETVPSPCLSTRCFATSCHQGRGQISQRRALAHFPGVDFAVGSALSARDRVFHVSDDNDDLRRAWKRERRLSTPDGPRAFVRVRISLQEAERRADAAVIA